MAKRNEIRMIDVEEKLFNVIKSLAKKGKRTIGKQAEWMAEQYYLIEKEEKALKK
jgi:hypothetical protein